MKREAVLAVSFLPLLLPPGNGGGENLIFSFWFLSLAFMFTGIFHLLASVYKRSGGKPEKIQEISFYASAILNFLALPAYVTLPSSRLFALAFLSITALNYYLLSKVRT